MNVQDRNAPTLAAALELLRAQKISPAALADDCLRRIERLNPTLRAFITVNDPQTAMSANGLGEALRGMPIAIKDMFDTAGIRTTYGSAFFGEHVPQQDAFVVDKLRQAGATLIGKANTHEIALGVTGNNPHYGTARNPWNTERVPGGSSSGSAIAVATGMALAALGTDTGGSIRIPASLCGVVGFKPTYGRVSLRGVFPLSWHLDHVGPLAACVQDAALVLQAIAEYDPLDPSAIRWPVERFAQCLNGDVKGMKLALAIGEFVESATDPEVFAAVRAAARQFQSLGCNVAEVNADWLREAAAANTLMTRSDGAAVHAQRLREHPEMFGEDVLRRLQEGANTTSAEYALARRRQTEFKKHCEFFFADYDALLLPTTAVVAPAILGNDAVEQAARLTRFTAPFNFAGLPAISLPCGWHSQGLPIGLQIVGGAGRDAQVLNIAHAYEQAAAWRARRPPVL